MDPNETLARLRDGLRRPMIGTDAEQFAQMFADLDDWLTSGGFAPDAWQRNSTQWATGPELTVSTGVSDEELRAIALTAAAQAWSGVDAGAGRDAKVLTTADKLLAWLRKS